MKGQFNCLFQRKVGDVPYHFNNTFPLLFFLLIVSSSHEIKDVWLFRQVKNTTLVTRKKSYLDKRGILHVYAIFSNKWLSSTDGNFFHKYPSNMCK